MSRLLIIDDDEAVALSTTALLRSAGHRVDCCLDIEAARKEFHSKQYDVVVSDLRMPNLSGIDLLREVHAASRDTQVIIMTAFGSIASAVEATKLGAFDYICKPYQASDLLQRIERAIGKNSAPTVTWNNHPFRGQNKSNIIGLSTEWESVTSRAETISQSDCTVLLTGETGTGKSLLARHIHDSSSRSKKPFISVNCANLNEGLLEAELFGSVKGAFTGAVVSRHGLCLAANNGTLFLDEIGVCSLTIQSKLLTLLQERLIRPVGGTDNIPVDIRIITATNVDLPALIRAKQFREDLFYRLNVARIYLPPLRERRGDILLLANHFLRSFSSKYRKVICGFSSEAEIKLANADLPGNVRELENVIERAVLNTTSEYVEVDDLLQDDEPFELDHQADEKQKLLESIVNNKYNLRKAASVLGVSRTTLYRRLHRHGIQAR